MPILTASEVAQVNSFPKLIALLRDQLEWEIPDDCGFEDVVFEYEPHELGLKPEETAKIREIHQLRPLVTGQPWGIFFLSLEDKAISVTVLRRMLHALVFKKRAGAQSAERQAWDKGDLIFAANFGKSGERELAFVHFSDSAATGDLPVMKVLGWNARDTRLHNDHVAKLLQSRLTWPDDVTDIGAWRANWAGAFETGHNEVIKTSQELAARLAALATDIRARANQLLDAEADDGPMRTMLEAFRKNLIQDLAEDGFADMFAQTICYGMLAARISRTSNDDGTGVLIADNMADMVPRTNPFLKELFGNFLKLGGRDKRRGMDFDELGVRDVVDMLNRANMDAVLRDFGNRNPKKDPVIHFYEDFLREYDRDQKVDAGIFYTPPAVVGFIVRGVDEMLRTEFGLPLGLADTTSWKDLAARHEKISVPEHVDPGAPFVQILDPATGTGTFLVEVIDLIHKRMIGHWQGEGKTPAQIKAAWNDYVPKHLLPRLTAFELKMAAYAIAHMKIGVKLVETGYAFGSDERAQILLTNTLQPARELDLEERMRLEAMAHEAERANEAKTKTPFTVVIGNPPYKGHSMNPSKIKGRLTFAGEIIQRFFEVRGEPLGEKNPKWLNNDYVKFIAFGMRQIERSGAGVLGYITSNSWLDGPTFRGVRTELMDCFPMLRIVDLHGNVSRAEVAPDGSDDEGVFAISEGTAIHVGTKLAVQPNVKTHDLIGAFDDSAAGKIRWLEDRNVGAGIQHELVPTRPLHLLVPSSELNKDEFYGLSVVREIFPINSVGFATANDGLTIQFSSTEMRQLGEKLLSVDFTQIEGERLTKAKPIEWRLQFNVSTGMIQLRKKAEARDWQVKSARDDLKRHVEAGGQPAKVHYRPFDERWSYFTNVTKGFMCMPRGDVMTHLAAGNADAVALMTSRMTKGEDFAHVHLCTSPAEVIGLSPKTSNNAFVFPLWLQPSVGEPHRRPNIDRNWALGFGAALGLTYDDGIPRGQQGSLGRDFIQPKAEQIGLLDTVWDGRGDLKQTIGPRDLFDFVYAVLHAPGYRSRYAEFLKSDFPRIPTPAERALFADLVPLGRELVAFHLLKADDAASLADPEIRLCGTGTARVETGYPQYENGRVKINTARWFEDVARDTYAFAVGGYAPCEKWLKDRAAKGGQSPREGRILTDADILHYRRIVVALTETRRLMEEVDAVIEKYGGWPGAFSIASAAAQVQLPALATLQDGCWTWSSIQPGDRLRYAAQYTLWQMDPATDASRLRFVIASLAEPALLTPLLSGDDRTAWLRLMGPEAQPQTGVVRLRPAINGAWRTMFQTMITSGQLAELTDGSWSRGQYFDGSALNAASADAQRAAFALGAVRAISADDLQAAVAPEDNVVWANFG